MRKNEKGFGVAGILVLVVIVGLIGAVGWLVYDRQKTPKQTSTAQTTTNTKTPQTQTPKEESKDVIPAGYNKYENTTNKYTFLYPESWSTVNSASTDVLIAPGSQEFPNIHIWLAEPNNSSCDQTSATVSKVTVAGIESEQYEGGAQTNNVTTCVPKNGKIFHIVHVYTDKDYKSEYQKLLESFKFTD